MVEQVTDLPLLIKVLGEELVLFRDLSGRLGLLHKHCSHRRASLEYGIPAERGLFAAATTAGCLTLTGEFSRCRVNPKTAQFPNVSVMAPIP